jgi:hypothetical protein
MLLSLKCLTPPFERWKGVIIRSIKKMTLVSLKGGIIRERSSLKRRDHKGT